MVSQILSHSLILQYYNNIIMPWILTWWIIRSSCIICSSRSRWNTYIVYNCRGKQVHNDQCYPYMSMIINLLPLDADVVPKLPRVGMSGTFVVTIKDDVWTVSHVVPMNIGLIGMKLARDNNIIILLLLSVRACVRPWEREVTGLSHLTRAKNFSLSGEL